MRDAVSDADVKAALLSSTAKSWFSAVAAWEAVIRDMREPLAFAFLAEASLRIGRFAAAQHCVARVPRPMAALPSMIEIGTAADAAMTVDPERIGGSDESTAGMALLEAGRYEAALQYWAESSDASSRDAPLRLAQAAYGLGAYDLAFEFANKVEVTGNNRFKALRENSQRGLERRQRLEGQAVNDLPHPIIRELRLLFSQDDATGLGPLTVLAVEWCVMAGDWSDLIVMMRRGMLAGDADIFRPVEPSHDPALLSFMASRQFQSVAGADFRAYAAACLDRRAVEHGGCR